VGTGPPKDVLYAAGHYDGNRPHIVDQSDYFANTHLFNLIELQVDAIAMRESAEKREAPVPNHIIFATTPPQAETKIARLIRIIRTRIQIQLKHTMHYMTHKARARGLLAFPCQLPLSPFTEKLHDPALPVTKGTFQAIAERERERKILNSTKTKHVYLIRVYKNDAQRHPSVAVSHEP
jgi:hypothetical protein